MRDIRRMMTDTATRRTAAMMAYASSDQRWRVLSHREQRRKLRNGMDSAIVTIAVVFSSCTRDSFG